MNCIFVSKELNIAWDTSSMECCPDFRSCIITQTAMMSSYALTTAKRNWNWRVWMKWRPEWLLSLFLLYFLNIWFTYSILEKLFLLYPEYLPNSHIFAVCFDEFGNDEDIGQRTVGGFCRKTCQKYRLREFSSVTDAWGSQSGRTDNRQVILDISYFSPSTFQR